MPETFYTKGRDLFDPSGKKVTLRGINKRSVQDETDPKGDTYFAEISKTGANSVRIVWAITKDLKPGGAKTDLDTLNAIITNARKNQLIPMVELHDATGDWDSLQKLVDYWVQPEVVSLLQKHQAYLLLNIGNGIGDDKVSQAKFTSGYNDAVKRLRDASIHVPLVIDATDSGKDLSILSATADRLIQADPDKNLIFSVHPYWPKLAGNDANSIQSKLQAAVALGYPLIVGEFSKYGGLAGNDAQGRALSVCSESGEIDYQSILKVCDELEIGWYAWEWGPGNGVSDPLCKAMDMTSDGLFDHLNPGWATEVVDSIKQASEKPDYFRLESLPKIFFSIQTRMKTLKSVITDSVHEKAVSYALNEASGDWPKALASLTEKKVVPPETLIKLDLAHTLADWSSDHVTIVKALANDATVTSLRDVALRFNNDKLTAMVDSASAPENTAGSTPDEKKKNFAVTLQHKLFTAEPTAVLHRMVRETEVPIADTNVRTGIVSFLVNQPDFNIHTASIYTALKHSDALKNVPEEHKPAVIEHLKTIQRVQAISPVPEAVPVLMKANLTSAFRVAEKPESTFLRAYGPTLGEETARQVYTNSINAHIRNEHALMTIREAMRGTGLNIIDGQQTKEERIAVLQKKTDENAVPLNLETLFGSIDYCECDDCLSVHSPASYFVEVLQYLRNNDLDPDALGLTKINPDPKDITNTPLEKLFRRRPDLGCLELTCENTFTVLPYVDLVNEVMESFVVHLDKYANAANKPQQATLEVFNVEKDETTSELLAQPQHVNYQAYCTLKSAVYPFTLPYHQPIDVIRIWLKYMGASRYELLNTYRTATETCASVVLTQDQQKTLQDLHGKVLDRAADAEFLGITQEEYIILTREAFWPRDYFDLTLQKVHTDPEYQEKIGVRPVHEYYGYIREVDMLSTDETLTKDTTKTLKPGLTFVKDQFLPRTGIQYVDLVELLKTRFINPNLPQGKALTILESIRSSYQFLQTKVDTHSHDRKARYAGLIEFLNKQQLVNARRQPDPCHKQNPPDCPQKVDFCNWVYCYFERIGKLIVLESGEEEPLLVGAIAYPEKQPGDVGTESPVEIQPPTILGGNSQQTRDTCDLGKVRLRHLDGTPLTPHEYDRVQRFIRLWHKLGWTIDEIDQALIGLSANSGIELRGGSTKSEDCDFVGFDAFQDDCVSKVGIDDDDCPKGKRNCPDIPHAPKNISSEFLHQLVAVQKLIDLTGLPLDKLPAHPGDLLSKTESSRRAAPLIVAEPDCLRLRVALQQQKIERHVFGGPGGARGQDVKFHDHRLGAAPALANAGADGRVNPRRRRCGRWRATPAKNASAPASGCGRTACGARRSSRAPGSRSS